jgi:hypothetical protein
MKNPTMRMSVTNPATYAMSSVIWKLSADAVCMRTNGPRSLSTR